MAWIKKKQVHWFGIAFIFIFNFIFYYSRVVQYLQIGLPVYFFICAVFALHLWFFNYLLVTLVHRVYPDLHYKVQKRLLVFFFVLPASVLLTTLFQYFFFRVLNRDSIEPHFYVHFEDVGMNLLFSLIIVFFLELLHYFRHWTTAVTESAALKQKNAETQLNSLKNQVSPHFLFNSLNSLSSLILSNPAQAVTFVHKLSGVYRYLLQSHEKNLVTLEEELVFLRSYIHLLQTRFGEALQCCIAIDAVYEPFLLPPLTLQLLVENAVKHNIIAVDRPLQIDVYNTGERLVVKNNLQKRRTPVISYGIGLVTIVSKYKLLAHSEVEIIESEDAFSVAVPLLKTDVYEGVDY